MRTATDALRSLQVYVAGCFDHLLEASWEVRWDAETVSLPFARVRSVGASLYAGPAFEVLVTQPMHIACYPTPKETAEEAELDAILVEEALFGAIRVGGWRMADPAEAPTVVGAEGNGTLAGTARYRYAKLDRWSNTTAVSPESAPVTLTLGRATVTLPEDPLGRYSIYRKLGAGAYGLVAVLKDETVWLDDGRVANFNGVPPSTNLTTIGAPLRVPLWDFDGKGLYDAVDESDRLLCDYMRVVDFSVNRLRDPDDDRRLIVTADVRLTWRRTGRIPPPAEVLQGINPNYDPTLNAEVWGTVQAP